MFVGIEKKSPLGAATPNRQEKVIDFFREFCWGRRERGRECAVALKRCPLFNVCNGNKGFWEDVEKIEVNGGLDDAKNG